MRRGPFCFSIRHCRVRHNVDMATAVLIKALGAFFAIMNPFVNLPLFLSLTQEQDAATQRRTAVRTTISSTVMCGVVLLLGATILRFFGIGVDDFRIAGGIVLLIISLSMLNGGGSSAHEGSTQEKAQHNVVADGGNDVAFYPMTFPILVGPGPIATIIVIQSQARGLGGHAAVAAALAAVLAALGIVLYFSASIGARLSMTMRTIMTRLMGMILASIAVQMIVVGIQHLFPGLAR